ncbi:MAG: gliding motility-associated C-terminal domain-containing protein [Saprospiraceae bacterium]|nr:gliding motility-associated C-terminal domain-containing protein [Saprospiraceae bacterium]
MVRCLLSFVFFTNITVLLTGQPVIDDFEQANIDEWQIIDGSAEISDIYAYADNYSVRVYKSSNTDSLPGMIKHRSFDDSYGKYRTKCYVLGEDAEARIRFHYENESNHYEVISRPLGTNQPGLLLFRTKNGERELLSSVPSLIHLDTWYQITIHRTCSGEIFVYVNDVLRIVSTDDELRQSGSIGLGAQGGSTYYDDVTFELDQGNIIVDIDTTICIGDLLIIGSKTYSQAGVYQDTVPVGLHCDSLLFVTLALQQPYEIHLIDTICSNEVLKFGEDTLRESGTYQQSLSAKSGCDSVITLTLWVLNGDTISLKENICHGDTYRFGDRELESPGIYFDMLSNESGCFAIRSLSLQVIEDISFLGQDTSLCFSMQPRFTLIHDLYSDIQWSDGSSGPSLTINDPGTYWGEVNLGSCTWRDSITFDNQCDTEISIYIPTAFSPNGDGINDIFKPLPSIVPRQFTLRIFDRLGRLVFTSFDPVQGWDGNVDGRRTQEGTYVYWLQADEKQYSGSVTILR